MANVSFPSEASNQEAHATRDGCASKVIEGIPVDFNSDGIPRIRDVDLAVKLGYARPRKIRELIRQLTETGALLGIHVRPATGRTSMPRGGNRSVAVDEYWLTEEQALLVAARSGTQIATELLKSVIRVFVLARHGQLGPLPASHPSSTVEQLSAPPVPLTLSLGDPDDPRSDAAVLLAGAERDLRNACKGGDVGHMLTRSALAAVRGARALLR